MVNIQKHIHSTTTTCTIVQGNGTTRLPMSSGLVVKGPRFNPSLGYEDFYEAMMCIIKSAKQ